MLFKNQFVTSRNYKFDFEERPVNLNCLKAKVLALLPMKSTKRIANHKVSTLALVMFT